MTKIKKISTKKEKQEKECKESKLMKRWLTRNEKVECGKAQSKKLQDGGENTECGLTQSVNNDETTSRNVRECHEERESPERGSAQSPKEPKEERSKECGLTQPINNAEIGKNVKAQSILRKEKKWQEEATGCGPTQPVNKTGDDAECGLAQSECDPAQSPGRISLRKRKRNGRLKYKLKKLEIGGVRCGNRCGTTKPKLAKTDVSKDKAWCELGTTKEIFVKEELKLKTECAQAQSSKSETSMSKQGSGKQWWKKDRIESEANPGKSFPSIPELQKLKCN